LSGRRLRPADGSRLVGRDPPADRIAPADRQDSSDQRDIPDRIEATLIAEPTEKTEANEPAEPIDRIEPLDPIDRIDPLDPIDRIEPLDPMLRIESEAAGERAEPSSEGMRAFSQRCPAGTSRRVSRRCARRDGRLDARDRWLLAAGRLGGGSDGQQECAFLIRPVQDPDLDRDETCRRRRGFPGAGVAEEARVSAAR